MLAQRARRSPVRIEGLARGEFTNSIDVPRWARERSQLLHARVRDGAATVLTAWRSD